MNSIQFTGEYTLNEGFDPGELPFLEEKVIDDLRFHVKCLSHVRNIRNERFMITRHDNGGKVTLAVDFDFTAIGKILNLIGVFR